MKTTSGTVNTPESAASAPESPCWRWPRHIAKLTMFGPGRNWHRLSVSVKSSSFIQCRRCTSARWAQLIAPPKPERLICMKAT